MIGNDVIDLKQASSESNWKRRGLLDKIFLPEEQFQILTSENPEKIFWVFWSMKEAAYKILHRITGVRAYIPIKFKCRMDTIDSQNASGTIEYQDTIYFSESTISADMIHTIATSKKNYRQRITQISPEIPLTRIGNLPFIEVGSALKPVSRSHHGRFDFTVGLIDA